MLEQILLAVDGSEHSKRAIPLAADIARKSKGTVVVVHVREHQVARGPVWERESEDEVKKLLEGVIGELKSAGIEAKSEARQALLGRAAQGICDAADEHEAGLIVMGSRGLSDFQGLLLGSVTHKVIQLARCPVLVTR
jgi:nucleotide-binding universal stress UspA family protein